MTQVIYRLKANRRKLSLSELRDFIDHMSHLDGDVKVEVFNGELAATVDAEANNQPGNDLGARIDASEIKIDEVWKGFHAFDRLSDQSEGWVGGVTLKTDPPRDELGRFTKRD